MTFWSASSNAITPALKVARAGARDALAFVTNATQVRSFWTGGRCVPCARRDAP